MKPRVLYNAGYLRLHWSTPWMLACPACRHTDQPGRYATHADAIRAANAHVRDPWHQLNETMKQEH